MNIFIIVITFFLFGFYYAVALDENKYIRKNIFVSAMLLAIANAIISYNNVIFSDFIFYIMVCVLLLFSVYFSYISSNSIHNILAKQVTFWKISSESLQEQYTNLLTFKEGVDEDNNKIKWTEVKELDIPYFFTEDEKDKPFHPQYKLELMHAMQTNDLLTKIEDLEYFKRKDIHILHKIIFEKLVNINISRQNDINFQYILYGNDFYLEYFFIELWEKLIKYEALGTGTLEYYCKHPKDHELIGALDNCLKSSIQKRGSLLWSKYLLHKNRVSYGN